MSTNFPPPKCIMFDIGGVCVASPFQQILDFETQNNIPHGYVNLCLSASKPNGFWHRLERGEILLDQAFYAGFAADLTNQAVWDKLHEKAGKGGKAPIPPLPKINGEKLFHQMMGAGTTKDPHIFPALQALRKSGKYIIAALSNTIITPPDHPFASFTIRNEFDIFVSSAHVGLRKPEKAIFEITLDAIDGYARRNRKGREEQGWGEGCRPEEVVFLDDIGENCKAGRERGIRTIKVNLGRTEEAVKELEEITGMQLSGEQAKL